MKTAVVFGPYGEFHAFNRFDCVYLYELRKKYDKIIAVVPYVAASLITYADEIICVSTEFLAKYNAHYPAILEQQIRDTPAYVASGFMKMATAYSNQHYHGCDFHLFNDDHAPCREVLNTLPPNCTICCMDNTPEYKNDLWIQFYHEFGQIGERIKEGNFIYPFQEDKNSIETKYGHMFKKDTFIVLTRNYSFKASMHNTRAEIIPHIQKLLDNNYGVINLGFPFLPTGIVNENYYEINDNMTYSEQMCLLYMSKGLICNGMGGAISSHMRIKFPIIMTDKMHPVYQHAWNERINAGLFSKKACMWEEDPITMEEFMKIVRECADVKVDKKYISNNKCIMLG